MLQGIRNKSGKGTKILYSQGVDRPEIQVLRPGNENLASDPSFLEAISISRKSDVIVFVGGISPNLEGEEMDVKVSGFSAGDRTTLELPENQQKLLEQLKLSGKPIILVLNNGSALAVNWAKENATAIVDAWYPGEEGGNAVADVLFGNYNPAGRLPVTFYKSVNDLPAFEDYSMNGRTYKYFKGVPLYAFGYGLSYTSFKYENAELKSTLLTESDTVVLSVKLSNTGTYEGDEVIQVYVKQPLDYKDQPIKSLVAFERVHFLKGETKEVVISIPLQRFRHFDKGFNNYSVAKGKYELGVGAASDDIRLKTYVEIK